MATEPNTLHHGDALAFMRGLPAASVDMVLTDPPYGTTQCEWDKAATGDDFWREVARVARPGAAVLIFGQEPFMSTMRLNHYVKYRYDYVWHKTAATGYLNAKKMPMRAHEYVAVFYDRLPTYHPQMTPGGAYTRKSNKRDGRSVYRKVASRRATEYSGRYPTDVITCKPVRMTYEQGRIHPTQKPLALVERLLKTYTDPGDVILDPFAGSGTTCVAALRAGRRFLASELDGEFYAAAAKRIADEARRLSSTLFDINNI